MTHRPHVLANAEFTKDMVQTLIDHFDVYVVHDVVTVEVTTHGLWLPNPHVSGRQFLGLARRPKEPSKYFEFPGGD